jgi:hypothetical protein
LPSLEISLPPLIFNENCKKWYGARKGPLANLSQRLEYDFGILIRAMQQWVQVVGSTLDLPDDGGNESTKRLLSAIKAIQTELGSVRNSFVAKISAFILNKCKFVRITAQSLDDAYILFRSFNSRGMPLNELDIIRAELVGSTDYDPKLAEEIAECWDHIQLEIGHDGFLVYVRTIVAMFNANAHTGHSTHPPQPGDW